MRRAEINAMIFQTTAMRSIYDCDAAVEYPGDTIVGRYFPFNRFVAAIENGALYFRRIDSFRDELEGLQPQSLWEIEGNKLQEWYRRNRQFIFVSCWNLDDCESLRMWEEYAQKEGVLLLTTVSQLTGTFQTVSDDTQPIDGFSLGGVRYDDEQATVFELMSRTLSNLHPVFGKQRRYDWENEYRVAMRPGSQTGELLASESNHDFECSGVYVPTNFDELINGLIYKSANMDSMEAELGALLETNNLTNISVSPSSLI